MNGFYILANKEKDINLEKTKAIAQFLELRGHKCGYCGIERVYDSEDALIKIRRGIPEDTECILVLGGDGTLIQVAGIISDMDIPMLGINMGNLGFLAEVEKDSVFDALEKVFSGEYHIEERMMLSGETNISGIKMKQVHALNDVVISRNGQLRIINFDIYVNQNLLYSISADGMIVSTPTGSTAYNLSAGGPIVAPYAEGILLTPICPHSLTMRPILLSKDDEIKIEIGSGSDFRNTAAEVTFDGGSACPLNEGDSVTIKKSFSNTKIIKISNKTFYETLSKKMSDR